jgi:hypothetical protein
MVYIRVQAQVIVPVPNEVPGSGSAETGGGFRVCQGRADVVIDRPQQGQQRRPEAVKDG